MNTDQKTAAVHDGIKALGILITALVAIVPKGWDDVLVAVPGLLTAAWGIYLTFKYNATPTTNAATPPTP